MTPIVKWQCDDTLLHTAAILLPNATLWRGRDLEEFNYSRTSKDKKAPIYYFRFEAGGGRGVLSAIQRLCLRKLKRSINCRRGSDSLRH